MASILDDLYGVGSDAVASLKRGTGQLIASGARAAQDVGLDSTGAANYGRELEAANAPRVASLADAAASPGAAVTEGVAGSLPALATSLTGAGIGTLAGNAVNLLARGRLPGAGKVGGIVGQGAADFVQNYGQNRLAQDQQGVDSPGAAALAATGQAAINQVTLDPAKRALRLPASEGIAGGVAANALGYAGLGAIASPVQAALTRAQAGQDLTSPEAKDEYGLAAAQGAVGGGILGGVGHLFHGEPSSNDGGKATSKKGEEASNEPPDLSGLSHTERMVVAHAMDPKETVVDPNAGAISRSLARGAQDGAVDHVVVKQPEPTLPVLGEESIAPAQAKSPEEAPVYKGGTPEAPIEIAGSKSLPAPERAVEQRAVDQVLSDPQKAIEDYKAIPGTDGGRIINTDEARELFPDYNAGPDNRSANAFAVHEPSSWVAKEAFRQRLDQPVEEGKDAVVMFTAGGTGAGKSTAIKRVPGMKEAYDKADTVYDGNLQGFSGAVSKVEQALESGRDAAIVYIHRDPIESFTKGALPRAAREDYGRTVPYDAHAGTHIGAATTLKQLADHYKDNPRVKVSVILNGKEVTVGGVKDVENVAALKHNDLVKELRNGLEEQRAAGKVPDRVYDYYRRADAQSGAQSEAGGEARPDGAVGQLHEGGGAPAEASQQQGAGLADFAAARASRSEQTKTPEFKAFFDGSKVANEHGEPLTVYHGTNQDIKKFSAARLGANTGAVSSKGFFFTEHPGEAGEYADMAARKQISNAPQQERESTRLLKAMDAALRRNDHDEYERLTLKLEDNEQEAMSGEERGANILPVHLAIKNPAVFDMKHGSDLIGLTAAMKAAKKAGHDGMRLDNVFDPVADRPSGESTRQWVAFDPRQIKSAIGNSGAFDPKSADIRARATDARDLTKPINGRGMAPVEVSHLADRQTKNWKQGPSVEVVPTSADLPQALRNALGNKTVDGAYDGSGKIYLVADQLNGAKDVRRVIAHEAYAHYGAKGILGDKFDEFLTRVDNLKDIDPDIRAAYESVNKRYPDIEPQERADEVVAHLAENYSTLKGRAKIVLAQIISSLKRFLSEKLNIKQEWSHNDVLAMISKAKGALSQSEKQIARTAEKARASVTDQAKEDVATHEPASTDIRASVPAPAESFDGWTRPSDKLERYLGSSARERLDAYRKVAGQKGDQLRTLFQDYFLPVRRVQEAITAAGGKVEDDSNVYGREELYYGRTGEKLRALEDDHVKPLVREMTKAGVSQEDLELYLYAKFAPERNARIAKINEKLPDGGSGMTNADAAKIVDDFKASGQHDALAKLADRVYALNEERVKALEDAGLIGKEEAAVWRADKHYVPLKGFADAGDDDKVQRPPIGAGFSVGGKEAWRALGRKSRATDILANAIAQTDQAIIRAEKNRVAQSLLKLATDNPNPKLWSIDKTVNKPGFDKSTGEVKYANRPEPDAVIAKVDGEEHRINIYDPRLMESMKNLGAAKVGAILRSFSAINRFLSLTRTTLAPEFMLANLSRDLQEATINTTGKLGAEAAANVIKNVPQSIRAVWGQLGGKNIGGEWGRYSQEFAESGGMTSFISQRSIEEQQSKIEGMLSEARSGAVVGGSRRLINGTLDLIEKTNGAVENAVRLSAYVQARKAGQSTEQAARFAKNLTVNFNRKGSAGAAMNAMYLFYNASIQGAARFLHALKSPKVQGMMGAIAATGFGLGYYNRMVGGKDDDGQDLWDKVSDSDKARNLIVMNAFGKGTNLKIPMPYTYNLPFILGSELADITQGKKDASTSTANVINALVGAFNPIGDYDVKKDPTEQTVKLAAPTALQPFIDLALNRNHFGSPISPEQSPFEKVKKPDSQSYFPSTNPGAVWMAGQLNKLTGGNQVRPGAIDISPASMVYLFDYLTGGTGSFFERTATAATLALKGEPVPIGKVPFVRTFASSLDDRRVNDTFYKVRDEVNEKAALGKLINKPGGLPDATAGDKADGKFGLALTGALASTDRELKKIGEAITYARSKKDDAGVKRLQATQRNIMLQFNRAYFRVKENQQGH